MNYILYQGFYMDGSWEQLKQVETALQDTERFGGPSNVQIVHASDLKGQIHAITGGLNYVLSFFTVLSFILSTFSFMNLLHIRVAYRRKDLAVLHIYGLNNKKRFLYTLMEMYLYAGIAVIMGIVCGYLTYWWMGRDISAFGVDSLNGGAFFVVFLKTIFLSFSSVFLFTWATLQQDRQVSPADILCREASVQKPGGALAAIFLGNVLYFGAALSLLLHSFSMLLVLLLIAVLAGAMFLVYLVVKRIFLVIIPGRSYLKIAKNFIARNNSRAPLSVITLALCLGFLFVVITLNNTLGHQVSDAVMRTYRYNVEASAELNSLEEFSEFLDGQGIASYYTVDKVNAALLGNQGVSITQQLAYQRNLEVGDELTLDVNGTQLTVKVAEVAKTSFRDLFTISISKSLVDRISADEPFLSERRTFYLNVPEKEIPLLHAYAADHKGIFVFELEQMGEDAFSIFGNYEYVFSLLSIYFLISGFITILTCSFITYQGRLQEFCIYEVYGASQRMLRSIILSEGMFMALLGGACGVLLSCVLFFYISAMVGVSMAIHIPLLAAISALAFAMLLLVSLIVLRKLHFSEMAGLLRDEG